jgi:hypothetical protein
MHMSSRHAGRQAGLGLVPLILGFIALAVVALFAMKVIPSYLEFRAAKSAIEAIARERQGATPGDIRRAFEARQNIDDINSLKSTDLEIGKDGNATTISFAYRKEVPLFRNVGLYIDYAASAGGQ